MEVFSLIIGILQFILDLLKWLYELNVYKFLSSKSFTLFNKSRKNDNRTKRKIISNDKKKTFIKRRLKAVFFFIKKDDSGYKNISGSKLIFALRKYETEDNCIKNIRYWKVCGYLDFDGSRIETMTIIRIIREEELLESIITCES